MWSFGIVLMALLWVAFVRKLVTLTIMLEIYRSANLVKVGYYKSVLEAANIGCYIKNENIALTEIPIPTFYPALCIMNAKDKDEAVKLISEKSFMEQDASAPSGNEMLADIPCPHCKEESPANFTECWSCSKPMNAE